MQEPRIMVTVAVSIEERKKMIELKKYDVKTIDIFRTGLEKKCKEFLKTK